MQLMPTTSSVALPGHRLLEFQLHTFLSIGGEFLFTEKHLVGGGEPEQQDGIWGAQG